MHTCSGVYVEARGYPAEANSLPPCESQHWSRLIFQAWQMPFPPKPPAGPPVSLVWCIFPLPLGTERRGTARLYSDIQISKEHLKTCSISLFIWKVAIKSVNPAPCGCRSWSFRRAGQTGAKVLWPVMLGSFKQKHLPLWVRVATWGLNQESQTLWSMPLVPVFRSQSGQHSEFQNSQSYIERLHLKRRNKEKMKKKVQLFARNIHPNIP